MSENEEPKFSPTQKNIMLAVGAVAVASAGFYVGYRTGQTDSAMTAPSGAGEATLFAKF
jgi:hypothetical protein